VNTAAGITATGTGCRSIMTAKTSGNGKSHGNEDCHVNTGCFFYIGIPDGRFHNFIGELQKKEYITGVFKIANRYNEQHTGFIHHSDFLINTVRAVNGGIK